MGATALPLIQSLILTQTVELRRAPIGGVVHSREGSEEVWVLIKAEDSCVEV